MAGFVLSLEVFVRLFVILKTIERPLGFLLRGHDYMCVWKKNHSSYGMIVVQRKSG